MIVNGVAPAWTRNLYRRMAFGRKHFFGQDDASQAADYYVMNPVPQKHASQWRPIFYRGDHPKYTGTSVTVGRAFRTGFWNSFQLQMGDGVHEICANQKRAYKRKSHARKQKWRKFWGRPEKPPEQPLEEDVPVEGFVTLFMAWRPRFFTRTVKWQLGGHEYRWTGTRRFMTGPFKKWKGVSHDFKLVDEHNNIIATFQKDRWVSYKSSEKVGSPPNKTRSLLGKLRRYPAPGAPPADEIIDSIRSLPPDESKFDKKLVKQLNLQGPHSGDLTEEAIAFTCWIVVEGEHRLRYKIFDLLEEVAETIGG
ncbi:hypothetical protein N657DRAFT_565928 [Parathielavia appendiculata]|uniref:Uncharacterized protein n=1 Tax=Parathielavia appendiculata TaxID=2587402 RepID=A0AAN6Z7E8_9PEZI|nr:hypothetical protein N657DRAFT_565928 [Parathielavia appendiculata]